MTRVLYIAGFGRSGSSILGNVLAEAEGVAHVGEARNVWDDGMLLDRRCGCQRRFRDCPFWTGVVSTLRNTHGEVDPAYIVEMRNRVARTRRALRWSLPTGTLAADLAELAPWLSALYSAVQTESDAEVIIDSTMSPVYGRVLAEIPELEVTVVHLVRDPRAVVNAWMREGLQDRSDAVSMRRYGMLASAGKWVLENQLTESLLRPKCPYLRIQYEEFATDPEGTVGLILDAVGIGRNRQPTFSQGSTIDIGVHHTVWGNPSRFLMGSTSIRDDRRWTTEFPEWRQATVAGLTRPLMKRYGLGSGVRLGTSGQDLRTEEP